MAHESKSLCSREIKITAVLNSRVSQNIFYNEETRFVFRAAYFSKNSFNSLSIKAVQPSIKFFFASSGYFAGINDSTPS